MRYKNKFLPVFSLDWLGLLEKLKKVEGEYGILAPISSNNNLLKSIQDCGKPFFIDSDAFAKQDYPWYHQQYCEYYNNRWIRETRLASEQYLRQKIREYLERCDRFSPDFVFTQDIFGEPLLSLYLAKLSWEEYWQRPRSYNLIGVVQVGYPIYNWHQKLVPQLDSLPPHYESPKSFIAPLISAYRDIGYEYIALGGLLQVDKNKNTGLTFGLSLDEFDELLAWSRPEFVLGGLALTRMEVLKKHKVWADTTGWLWWNEVYDRERFSNRDVFREYFGFTSYLNNNTHQCDTYKLS
jgi:hypothetical protein